MNVIYHYYNNNNKFRVVFTVLLSLHTSLLIPSPIDKNPSLPKPR